MQCIGNCHRHAGKIHTVTIYAHGLESTPLPYCEAAIASDIENGYRVKIHSDNNEVANALWMILFLAALAAYFLLM